MFTNKTNERDQWKRAGHQAGPDPGPEGRDTGGGGGQHQLYIRTGRNYVTARVRLQKSTGSAVTWLGGKRVGL